MPVRKTYNKKNMFKFQNHLKKCLLLFRSVSGVNDAGSSHWENWHFLITSITKVNPCCYSLIQRNVISKTKTVLQNFLVFSCIEMLSPITYIRNNISCLSQSRWPIWFLIFLPLLWYCQFKSLILFLYSAIRVPDQGFVLVSSCRAKISHFCKIFALLASASESLEQIYCRSNVIWKDEIQRDNCLLTYRKIKMILSLNDL